MKPRRPRLSPQVADATERLYISQLLSWPDCAANYEALARTERRDFSLGDFQGAIQYNPHRRKSTTAKTDAASIAARPCFLCAENRPKEQIESPVPGGFTILVNPYPIFPLHLTIAADTHRPQDNWPWEMISIADTLRGMVVFFNGAKAGASAPDHLHLQAVADGELPLVRLVEKHHTPGKGAFMLSTDFGADLPYGFLSFIVPADEEGTALMLRASRICGYSPREAKADPALLNVFFWHQPSVGVRCVIIPRKAHRPECFFAVGSGHHNISPGAVDMAGVIVAPDREDFDSLTQSDIRKIYAQTSFPPEEFLALKDIIFPE